MEDMDEPDGDVNDDGGNTEDMDNVESAIDIPVIGENSIVDTPTIVLINVV